VRYVTSAFVLIGAPDAHELSPQIGAVQFNNNLQSAPGASVFGLGGPKDLKHFFRWNIPYLVYSFDASFVNYFGFEGMEAVHDAYQVLNDFFVPEDGSYSGMSELSLTRHGFSGNFNTAWVNTTAQNAQILDIKSIVLGLVVTQLGIGNPHRHAFSMIGGTTNAWNTAYNFHVGLRNYDPNSYKETDIINGVQYAYRLITESATPGAVVGGLPNAGPNNILDMEEFTADTSGNAWTAVSGILDAFYGDTMVYWTDQPTLYNFGVYYDSMNAMGGQYQPRHALTFDDAGGLKYLYKTNTFAWEANGVAPHNDSVTLINPPQLLPTTQAQMSALNPNWSGVPAGLHFQNNTGNQFPFFPRRGTIIPSFRYTLPIFGQPVIGSTPGNSWQFGANNIGPGDISLRGGIDKIQFYHQPFDSLLGNIFVRTNFVWSIPFVYETGYNIGGLNNTTPGSSAWQGQKQFQFHTMTVGRNVIEPDFIFVCDDLGTSGDGVPIAYARGQTNHYEGFGPNNANLGFVTTFNSLPDAGPGVIHPMPTGGGTNITYSFTKLHQNFEMIWSGETTVVGNQISAPSLWGHIKGPGPNDLVMFPRDATMWRVENEVIPNAAPPTITLISDNGGVGPIEQNTYTRTEETLTIIGNEMASVTAIEIMSGNLVLHTVMPVHKYIVSNSQIDLPPGTLGEFAEGAALEIRVWNSVGASQKGPQKFNIETGRPVITLTTADGIAHDRAETMTVRGYGFKSKKVGQTKLAFLRIDDSLGSAVYDDGIAGGNPSNGLPVAANIDVRDDTTAIIPVNAIGSRADGSNRRLRVARYQVTPPSDVNSILSPPNNGFIAVITSKPVIDSLMQLSADSTSWEDIQVTDMFKRDRVLEINGTAMNSLDIIEVVLANGSSFPNPVFIQLPNSAVTVEDNGTRVLVGANAIPYSDADTNSSIQRGFRLYNAVGTTDLNGSLLFAVNKQPSITAVGGFANAGMFNRDAVVGNDVNIFGSGLQAIGEIHIVDVNGSDMNASAIPQITLPHPGVTITDTQILIDTQVAQFSEGSTADTDVNTTHRIMKFVSARNNAFSPQADRFSVGVPPTSPTVSNISGGINYRRDSDTMTISGSGLGMVTQVEIVDIFGNPIPGTGSVTPLTQLNIMNSTTLTITPNAAGWSGVENSLDHVTAFGRRIKITTPFGAVTSGNSTGGAFTVSATPTFGADAITTFAIDPVSGGSYNSAIGANGTYFSGGQLVLNGGNFRGVKTLTFTRVLPLPAVDLNSTAIDPNNPSNGIWVSPDGTQMIIQSTVVDPNWVNASTSDGAIKLTSAADQNTTTQTIATAP